MPDSITGATTAPPAAAEEAARHGWRVLAILSALMGFASISTDLYLPAMPAMGRALNTDTGTVELTVSGYLIGFSLGQLVWGPIGDRYGRRLPVAIGLVLFIIGSAGCALAPTAGAMIGWRVVQAVGACAGVVLARAMVRDLYAGHRAAQMMSTLMTVMASPHCWAPSWAAKSWRWPVGAPSSGRWWAWVSPPWRPWPPCPRRCQPPGAVWNR
ncbi:MAG: MFS transporter [Azospirillaceae bacterium]|nr:MFS transporter [Azospirillaceae bacterium]